MRFNFKRLQISALLLIFVVAIAISVYADDSRRRQFCARSQELLLNALQLYFEHDGDLNDFDPYTIHDRLLEKGYIRSEVNCRYGENAKYIITYSEQDDRFYVACPVHGVYEELPKQVREDRACNVPYALFVPEFLGVALFIIATVFIFVFLRRNIHSKPAIRLLLVFYSVHTLISLITLTSPLATQMFARRSQVLFGFWPVVLIIAFAFKFFIKRAEQNNTAIKVGTENKIFTIIFLAVQMFCGALATPGIFTHAMLYVTVFEAFISLIKSVVFSSVPAAALWFIFRPVKKIDETQQLDRKNINALAAFLLLSFVIYSAGSFIFGHSFVE